MRYIIFPWKSKREYQIIKNSLTDLNISVLKNEGHHFGKHTTVEKLLFKYRKELTADGMTVLPDYKSCGEIVKLVEKLNHSRNETVDTTLYTAVFLAVVILCNGFFMELLVKKISE